MRSVVAVHSKFLLELFLWANKRKFLRLSMFLKSPMNCHSDVAALLVNNNIQELHNHVFPEKKKAEVLSDYIKIIDSLSVSNGSDPLWWATDIASKNRFMSPVLKILTEYVKYAEVIQLNNKIEDFLFVIYPSWQLSGILKKSAIEENWKFKTLAWPFSSYVSQLLSFIKAIFILIRSVISATFRISTARRYFGSFKNKGSNSKPIFLIKSFVYPHSFLKDGNYNDPFFGKLTEKVSKHLGGKLDVITVALGFSDFKECYRKLKAVKNLNIVPFEAWLDYRDVIKAFLLLIQKGIRNPFRVKEEVSFLGNSVTQIFKKIISQEIWKISLLQLLHYHAGLNLTDCYKIKTCVLTCENNPWEKMLIRSFTESQPDTTVIGYQHAVIPQSAVGMFWGIKELKLSPTPDKILTTGEIPALIMQKYGNYPSNRIYQACALRYDYLHNSNFSDLKKSRINQVLIPLEGDKDVISLVEYVKEQSIFLKDRTFKFRAHPSLPFERLSAMMNWENVPKNIEISQGTSVLEDIENCDTVLYWGTTVALEAIMAGKPVIHFDRGDLLSFDPLFDLDAFKWQVDKSQELLSIIDQIECIPIDEYKDLHTIARDYVKNYFFPVTDDVIKLFCLEK
ncbi:hypothetical protein KJ966_09870 [bacterium]|nr:hypothetical protein [bacterium]